MLIALFLLICIPEHEASASKKEKHQTKVRTRPQPIHELQTVSNSFASWTTMDYSGVEMNGFYVFI